MGLGGRRGRRSCRELSPQVSSPQVQGLGSPQGLGARSPCMQAGERCRRCGVRLSRTRYCDGLEQLMCQWSLLGGRVFSGLMNRRAVMGSSQPPGPGGLFGGKKGDARAFRGVCTVWGVCVGCLGRDSLGRCGSGGSLLPCPCSLSREGKFGGSCWACRGSWGGRRDPSGAHTSHCAARVGVLQGSARLLPLHPRVSRFPCFCKG